MSVTNESGLFASVTRSTLGIQARDQIRERIVDGRLAPATRIAESQLASQLGISRTPLHSAMTMLSREGLVEPQGRKGWLVTPLTVRGASELYPVLGTTECLAFDTAGHVVLGAVDELLRSLATAPEDGDASPLRQLERERDWHELILRRCSNETLVTMVRSLAIQVFRYEVACVRHTKRALPTELADVTRCLENRNLAGACRLIAMHWRERAAAVLAIVPELTRAAAIGSMTPASSA